MAGGAGFAGDILNRANPMALRASVRYVASGCPVRDPDAFGILRGRKPERRTPWGVRRVDCLVEVTSLEPQDFFFISEEELMTACRLRA